LDSPLLFFIMATVWTFVASWKYEDEEKSVKWWLWSVAAGICLTGSFTVKFVGLFVIMWVGMVTITRLLHYWSSASGTSLETFVKQLLSRAVCLIAVPLFFYILIYFIHFKVLYKSGGGDPHYSSEFQVFSNK
jgi:dolichyl-phosphate-mannose-protein mannosyltransferase